MPEGHTLHRLARDHHRWFASSVVRVDAAQETFAAAAGLLDGRTLTRAEAYGKHLFHFYGADVVHVHLGLFGRFLTHESPPDPPRSTVRYRVVGAERTIDLVGATRCALVTPADVEDVKNRLGPDPLRRDGHPDDGWHALERRRVEIGRALMDQSVIAGVGNVFRAELLFAFGIHPLVPSSQIDRATWDAMWQQLTKWMRSGVRTNRIVTIDPTELGWSRTRVARERATYVYRQDHCRRCGTPVRRWDLAGRWAYACESCQPRPSG